jgi:hypothetical protein
VKRIIPKLESLTSGRNLIVPATKVSLHWFHLCDPLCHNHLVKIFMFRNSPYYKVNLGRTKLIKRGVFGRKNAADSSFLSYDYTSITARIGWSTLNLKQSLYKILQLLSIDTFEQIPLNELPMNNKNQSQNPCNHYKLVL